MTNFRAGQRWIGLVMVLSVLLTGCGQKGELYLPKGRLTIGMTR